jgi:hypothetical protein
MNAVFLHPLPLWGIAVDKYKIDITEMVVVATAIISIALAARDAAGAQWISEEWGEARLIMAPDQPPGVRSAASSDRCPSAERGSSLVNRAGVACGVARSRKVRRPAAPLESVPHLRKRGRCPEITLRLSDHPLTFAARGAQASSASGALR